MPVRVLTERELNRALLARQHLLTRTRVPVPRLLEAIGGIQAQYAPSVYVGAWTRLEGLERGRLTEALERRSVVQGTLMRVTIHLISRRDYWPIAKAVAEPSRAWWLRTTGRHDEGAAMAELARRLERLLADGPRRRSELMDALGVDASTWTGVGLWTQLVRVPPSGTWEHRRADHYALAERWVGAAISSVREGRELLIRRYLHGFGPASRTDIASFTGLSPTEVSAAVDTMPLRTLRGPAGEELLDLRGAPLPEASTPAPVRFLPTWDATLLVHARRTQIMPERFRPLVFDTKIPHSSPTFLVDGQVAGTWRYEGGAIRMNPFDTLPRATRRELHDEAARLAAFHA